MEDAGRLVFEIQNTRPVELFDLTDALVAFGKEYSAYADTALEGEYRAETKLYVREIRAGSIIAELVPQAAALLPLVSDLNAVIGFAKHLGSVVDWLLGKTKKPAAVTVPTLQNVKSIVEPVAKDSASQLIIHSEVHNHGPVYININSSEASELQNRADREIRSMREPLLGLHKDVVMYLWQTRNDTLTNAGDKAIIESLFPKATKVIFEREIDKLTVLRLEKNIFDRAFLVDVKTETVDGKPILYKVVELKEVMDKP